MGQPGVRSSDVIVIGAGLAGLRAARDLRDAGLDVVVLEGRDRVGGRAYTRPFKGTERQIDLGGSWVVPEHQPHVAQEIDRYGLSLVHSPATQNYRTNVGGHRLTGYSPVPLEDVGHMERALFHLMTASRRLDFGRPYDRQDVRDLDVSLADLLRPLGLPESVFEYIATWMPASHPEEATALGFLSWLAGFDNSAWNLYSAIDRKFDPGSQLLATTLAESAAADLRLDSPATTVALSDDGSVEVTIRGGDRFLAPVGVLATPLNTWNRIDFQPGLSALKAEAAATGHLGAGQKLWLRLDAAPAGMVAIGKSPAGMNWLFEEYQLDGDSLSVAFAGPYPTRSTLDFTDLAAVQQAVEFFAPGARVVEVDYHDWNQDEFSLGTWVTHRPGAISRFHSALREPHGGLFFAGSDVSYGWAAWFEGALETGAAAAQQALVHRRRLRA